jgi:hypothetical protein
MPYFQSLIIKYLVVNRRANHRKKRPKMGKKASFWGYGRKCRRGLNIRFIYTKKTDMEKVISGV